jgi:hypothetical protein
MAVPAQEWLELIEREYLTDFILAGGGAVKFAVGDAHQLEIVARVLDLLSARHGLAHVAIDAVTTRLHMIHNVFVAIAGRSIGMQWRSASLSRCLEGWVKIGPARAKRCRFMFWQNAISWM